MFYTEEDIQPTVDAVTTLLGPAGNMAHGRNVLPNVTVSTPPYGKVWYGDYEGTVDELQSRMAEVSVKLGMPLEFQINQM